MKNRIIQIAITMPFGDRKNTVYPTLLWDENNAILVDCGYVGALPYLERELARYGLTVGQLTGLVLTHHDHDHMGAAAALKRVSPRLKIYASEEEAPYISGREKSLRLCQAEERQKTRPPEERDSGKAFCDMLRKVEPVEVDVFLRDGEVMDWCGGCRVIATPGHMPGHISLFMEKDLIIITGDAMTIKDGLPAAANPQFTFDIEQAAKSTEKLMSLKAKAYYCYHGGICSPENRKP